MPVEW